MAGNRGTRDRRQSDDRNEGINGLLSETGPEELEAGLLQDRKLTYQHLFEERVQKNLFQIQIIY